MEKVLHNRLDLICNNINPNIICNNINNSSSSHVCHADTHFRKTLNCFMILSEELAK